MLQIELFPEKLPKELAPFFIDLKSQLLQAQFPAILEEAKTNHTTWDAIARKVIGGLVRTVGKNAFGPEKLNFYLEGDKESKIRFKPRMTKMGIGDPTLFGSSLFPDAAIFEPVRLAIEFDHSGEGKPGGALKMAIGKAAANCLTGWPFCVEIFYNQTNEPLRIESPEKSFLDFYSKPPCNTFCIVVK